jgi:hypothetical protein
MVSGEDAADHRPIAQAKVVGRVRSRIAQQGRPTLGPPAGGGGALLCVDRREGPELSIEAEREYQR